MVRESEFFERKARMTANGEVIDLVTKPVGESRVTELLAVLPVLELDRFYASFVTAVTVLARGVIYEETISDAQARPMMRAINEILHLTAGQVSAAVRGEPDKRYPIDVFVKSAFEHARKAALERNLELCISHPLWASLARADVLTDD